MADIYARMYELSWSNVMVEVNPSMSSIEVAIVESVTMVILAEAIAPGVVVVLAVPLYW